MKPILRVFNGHGKTLVIIWEGEPYLLVVWSRFRDMRDHKILFRGFSDGAENTVAISRPSATKIYIQGAYADGRELSDVVEVPASSATNSRL